MSWLEEHGLTLKPDLLSTIIIDEVDPAVVRKAAASVLGRPTDYVTSVLIVQYRLQIEWYDHHGRPVPSPVSSRFNTLLQGAPMNDDPVAAPQADSAAPKRAGLRPFCRSLIDDGITDEQALLEAVHLKFPEKAYVFGIADVRGCLRNAGKLPWTKRKKS